MAILLDTNAYLRLGKQFSPLLGYSFVLPPESLLVLSEVDTEVSANPRLETKFSWALDPSHSLNRSQNICRINGCQATEIINARTVVSGISDSFKQSGTYKKHNLTPPSPTDCLVLAYASVLEMRVVSDDGGMCFLAKDLCIDSLGSLNLMKIMLDSGKITLEMIQTHAKYLNYIYDLPNKWKTDSQLLLGVKLP